MNTVFNLNFIPVYPGKDIKIGETLYTKDGAKIEVTGISQDCGVRSFFNYYCASELFRKNND